jgi:bifunctional non-homologous end joining protein LigD
MQPVLGELPPRSPGWLYEVDWAGVRLLADVDEGHLRLHTADGEDVTSRFPEFSGLSEVVADGLLDGEAVMLDAGSPSSTALDERLRAGDAKRARTLARQRPAVFMVYDVLRLYGVPLTPRPLDERRAVLGRLDLSRATRIQISPAYDDGAALLAGVVDQGLAGVIAKRRDSVYRAGDGEGAWLRVTADRAPTPVPAAPVERRRVVDERLLDVDAIGRAAQPAPQGRLF